MPQNNLLLYCRGHAVQDCPAKGSRYAYQRMECKRHYERSLDWIICYMTYILILRVSLFCQIIYSSVRGLFNYLKTS